MVLTEQRRRRLLSPMPAMREWVWIVQLWVALAAAITAIVVMLDLPGSLELRGWVAAAFVWLPGPAIATGAAGVRAIGLRNPQSRALRDRVEQIRSYAALSLENEIAALEGARVVVEEHDLELRQAWLLTSESDGAPTWVLAGDTHVLVIGGELPSTQVHEHDAVLPRHWIVERLPETARVLSMRTLGSSIPLDRGTWPGQFETRRCELLTIERLPPELAQVTVGLAGPYR